MDIVKTTRPLGDRILLKVDRQDEHVRNGILIPAGPPGLTGDIVAIGPGWRANNGKLIPMDVEVGEKVIFIADTGQPTEINGEKFMMHRQHDLIAVLELEDEPEDILRDVETPAIV